MAVTIDNIFTKTVEKEANVRFKREAAIRWLRDRTSGLNASAPQIINEMKSRQKDTAIIGKMYLFQYSAKHAATLPYWDKFPLIFPIGMDWGYVTGINFHYLDMRLRAFFLDHLWQFANNDRLDQHTKLQLSYEMLKSSSANKYVKPTIHRYLATHVRSKFLLIDPSEWAVAIFLPIQQFQKASIQTVYKDSRNKMRGT